MTGWKSGARRRPRLMAVLAVVVGVALLAAACGDDDDDDNAAKSTTTTAATSSTPAQSGGIKVRAGLNDPTDGNIAVTEFLPEKVTVATGSKVSWGWSGTEPHSVTFKDGGKLPPPGPPDEALFAPTPPTGDYDGTAPLVNSGLLPQGPQAPPDFTLTFAKAGTYLYFCVIHPGMTGEVDVVDDAGKADTAKAVTDRGDAALDGYLTEGRAAKKKLAEAPPRKEAAGAANNWFVEMGTTTEHTDILAFSPVPVAVKAGDKVTFVNNSQAPHTATFGPVPPNPTDPKVVNPAPGPSPQPLVGGGAFLNTGQLPPDSPPGAGPPLAARSYTYTVPTAGNYSFVCALHVASGMAGSINAS